MEVCEDRISALPDDLLVKILSQARTKDAVHTMFLSNRWRFVWKMVTKLDYMVIYDGDKRVWDFLHKSMQLNRSHLLESLRLQLGCECPVNADANIAKWVSNAVYRSVPELNLQFYSCSRPHNLPTCLYTSKMLVKLALSFHILIDVPSSVCLPSLKSLDLSYVVYKNEDALVRLLSGCLVLKDLVVFRYYKDNVTKFSVEVSSLERLIYMNYGIETSGGSLVIDSPGLHYLKIHAPSEDYCSVQNMPYLDVADVNVRFRSHHDEKLLGSFSSVRFLKLVLKELAYFGAKNFSQLIELKLHIPDDAHSDWLKPLMLLLHDAHKLKVLLIDTDTIYFYRNSPLSWNQPDYVPRCLLSHLEIFEWKAYKGRKGEKNLVAYILANSKCLKMVGISPRAYDGLWEEKKMMEELESMYRVSASSQLLFSTKVNWRHKK